MERTVSTDDFESLQQNLEPTQQQPPQGTENNLGQPENLLPQVLPHNQADPDIEGVMEPVQDRQNINPMAVSFKPASFNGLHAEAAGRWWRAFERYATLSGTQGNHRCTLLGLLLTGSAEIWFNSLQPQVRDDFGALEAAFREKYITAAHTQLQRQMAILSRSQRQGESVDEYITDTHSKMMDYNYDNNLQMTLIINGLRPEIKTLVMQHQPFDGLEDLTNKARHIESALKAQSTLTLPTYAMNLTASSSSMNDPCDVLKEQTKDLQKSIQVLSERFDSFSQQLSRQQMPNRVNQPRHNWQGRQSYNGQVPWQKPSNSFQPQNTDQNRRPTCWNCGRLGHVQKNCRVSQHSSTSDTMRRARSPDGRFRSPSPGPQRKFKGN